MSTVPGDMAVTRPLLLTVAMLLLPVDQVTARLVALVGSTVATNCRVSPAVNMALFLFKVMDVARMRWVTVTTQVAAKLDPSVVAAIMIAVPGDFAVTTPLLSTVATLLLLVDQVTVLLVVLLGSTVAVSCIFSPSIISALLLFKEMEVARMRCVTVKLHDARKLVQSEVFAVIVAEPADFAVTTPLLSTVATLLLLVDQVTALFVVLFGSTVAVSCIVSPSIISALLLSSEIEVARTELCLTVTEHEALRLLPSVVLAVMVALPTAFAVTNPLLLTVATELLLVVQVTVLFVVLLGSTVAVSCIVFPLPNSALVLSSEMENARIGSISTILLKYDPHLEDS